MPNRRVLIVDDDATSSDLAALMGKNTRGFELRLENDPAIALQAAHEFGPHVIVLDIDMPENAGADLLLALSRDSALRHVPVLFLTRRATNRSETGEPKADGGARPILAKPVDPVVLLEAVAHLLDLEHGS